MKKKVLLICLITIMIFTVMPVFAKDISSCNNVLKGVAIDRKIPDTVHNVVTLIKIAVPILLIIFGMLDLMKGITAQKEEEIKKGQQIFVKRLIAGALVFFVFVIVQLIISFVATGDSDNMKACVNCFINGECKYT